MMNLKSQIFESKKINELSMSDEEFKNYILKMSDEDIKKVLAFIQLPSMKFMNFSDNDLKIGKRYKNYFENLICKEFLEGREKKIAKSFLIDSLLYNIDTYKDKIDYFVNMNLLNERKNNFEELVLFNQYFLNYLNSYYNFNIKLDYDNLHDIYAKYEIGKNLIVVNSNYYNNNAKKIDYESYLYMFVYQTYAISHEFFHAVEYEYISKKPEEKLSKEYQDELNIVSNHQNLYNSFHNNFKFEKDADTFAMNHLNFFLTKLLTKEEIEIYGSVIKNELEKHYEETNSVEKIFEEAKSSILGRK